MLQEKFTKFASETNSIGQQRMEQVNKMVNEMIDCGHSDAATIAEWKDGLNESWADLLELMETRRQMLAASYQLHKFFTDCKEVQPKQISGSDKAYRILHCHFKDRQSGRDVLSIFKVLMMMTLSCVVGLGSDCREDEAVARGEGVPSQHYQSSHPAETHALL